MRDGTQPLPHFTFEPTFEWDERKAAINKKKHGISFLLATRVFADPLVDIETEGDDHGETRWKAIGQVGRLFVRVTFTYWQEEGGEIIRLISARPITPKERRAYQGHPEDDG